MKKVIVILAVVAFMAGSTLAFAGNSWMWAMGPDGKPKGCLCDIKGTVLMAQNEADCSKVGGKVVKPAKDAGSKAK